MPFEANSYYEVASGHFPFLLEAVNTSGTSLNIYQTTWSNVPEDSHLRACRLANLKSDTDL
jgi:hypothetical protein